jgi:hypothetical protein
VIKKSRLFFLDFIASNLANKINFLIYFVLNCIEKFLRISLNNGIKTCYDLSI